MKNEQIKMSVVGLGKLGSPLAAVLADSGHSVIGVDLSERYVESINSGIPPVKEPGLAELITRNRSRLKATTKMEEAINNSTITFIVVPTPSQSDGSFSTEFVVSAINSIGATLRQKSEFHLVVLTSTVMPGDCDRVILPALAIASGKQIGRDFGFCYNPEFIALGNVIKGLTEPDFILIGESDNRSGTLLEELYKKICKPNTRIARMNFVNAELAKLSVNTFVTTKISYANMLAEFCERLPGGDVETITSAIGMDSRIGKKYLKGALGFGGPCFPRDNLAFISLGRRIGVTAHLAEATNSINSAQAQRLSQQTLSYLKTSDKVGILGLSYKPDTDVIEESQALKLATSLIERNVRVAVFDPIALENVRKILGDTVEYSINAAECIKASDVIVIATPWEEFRDLDIVNLLKGSGRKVIIDCWRIMDQAKVEKVANYVTLGRFPENKK